MATSAVPMTIGCTDRHREAEEVDPAPHPGGIGIGADARSEHAAKGVLDHEGRADGADQRGERGDMAERPVADALDDQRRRRADRHRQHQDAAHGQERMGVEEAGAVEGPGQEEGREGAGHGDVAVGEVDQPQNAVDHGVAERDQPIDAADGQAEHEQIEPLRAGVGALHEGADRAADDHHDDPEAQQQQDHVDIGDPVQIPQSPRPGGPGARQALRGHESVRGCLDESNRRAGHSERRVAGSQPDHPDRGSILRPT